MDYTIKAKEKVRAIGTISVSTEHAIKVCRVLNRKKFSAAKKILQGLVNKEDDSLDGKFFTKTSTEILAILNQLENNAKNMNVDAGTLNLFISAHRGPTMYRAKRDRRHGIKLKSTHVQAVLSDKNGFGKKVH